MTITTNQTFPDHQGWKKGQHGMGNVRAYQPEAPPVEDEPINPNTYNFKLVKVEVNNSKSGWSRFTFLLPQSVRALYARDVVFGPDWRALCQEFDDRCHCCKWIFPGRKFKTHSGGKRFKPPLLILETTMIGKCPH